MTQSDIDTAFIQDQALFPDLTAVQQLNWSGDPVAISGFTGAQPGVSDWPVSNAITSLGVALYTSNGSVSLNVDTPSFPFSSDFPSDQLPSGRVWLTDTAGNQLTSTTGQKLSFNLPVQSISTTQKVTFDNIPRPAGVTAGTNFGVIAHADAAGYYTSIHITPAPFNGVTSRIAWVGDQVTRLSPIHTPGTSGYYFYVPKGTANIQFTWERFVRTYGNDLISSYLEPPQIYDDTGALRSTGNAGFQEMGSIPVNPQAGPDPSGKLWRVARSGSGHSASRFWFYNLPNYFTVFPDQLVLPRDLAVHDNLTIVP